MMLRVAIMAAALAEGGELDDARALFVRGEYGQVIAQAASRANAEPPEPRWALLQVQAMMATGQYPAALQVLQQGLSTFPNNLQMRLLGYQVLRANGNPTAARKLLDELDRLAGRSWLFQQPEDRIALGEAAVLLNVDARKVMESFFTPIKKTHPELREVYLASGELALKKNDFATAAKTFDEAAQRFPADPDVQFGRARAYQPSDSETSQQALQATLAANPHHVGAHLLLAETHIDAERPEEAAAEIEAALKVDPLRPEAHALRAVLAELAGRAAEIEPARRAALKSWATNPAVEHLIGRKLSQKYRFAEGAAHQRKALEWEPGNLAASLQLAQDLLRLGEEDEGWKLAQRVHDADPYNVVAFNLVALEEQVSTFSALTSPHFLVKMAPKEAALYGDRVLALLERAYEQVGSKYGLDPQQRTTVEIFPDQKDFAIRTFGLPGGQGYLGVCFGHVITAISPAAVPGATNNWEAVLWHEFTHVVTLGLTKNRMPRWLSEGISVYEEQQANGSWGEQMKPRYRAMILGEDLVPLSKLSGAFLRPKTPAHLQFAYYESSLAVEFLLERGGLGKMKAIFADLAKGSPLSVALARHVGELETLDREFAERIQALARGVAPRLDWSQPPPDALASAAAMNAWTAAHPTNFYALKSLADVAMKARDWTTARKPLEKLVELYPDQHEEDGAYAQLASVYRQLGLAEEELSCLNKLVSLNDDARDALDRLTEIHADKGEWDSVTKLVDRMIAIDPFVPLPYERQGRAWQMLNKPPLAIRAYENVLKTSGGSKADAHFQLANLLKADGKSAEAKRHLLQALEEAPRYRQALHLLLELEAPLQVN